MHEVRVDRREPWMVNEMPQNMLPHAHEFLSAVGCEIEASKELPASGLRSYVELQCGRGRWVRAIFCDRTIKALGVGAEPLFKNLQEGDLLLCGETGVGVKDLACQRYTRGLAAVRE
jgi:hypothetical protein